MTTRKEIVPIDLVRPRVMRTITVVACTDAVVEAQIAVNGSAADAASYHSAVFHVTVDLATNTGFDVAGEFDAERVGVITFAIPNDRLTTAGKYRWQIIASTNGEDIVELGRGILETMGNPAAEYEPIVVDDPPFVRKDEVLAEVSAASELPVQSKALATALAKLATKSELASALANYLLKSNVVAPTADASSAGKAADAMLTGDALNALNDAIGQCLTEPDLNNLSVDILTGGSVTAGAVYIQGDAAATEAYVNGIVGDINSALDAINGEVI